MARPLSEETLSGKWFRPKVSAWLLGGTPGVMQARATHRGIVCYAHAACLDRPSQPLAVQQGCKEDAGADVSPELSAWQGNLRVKLLECMPLLDVLLQVYMKHQMTAG